jgi:hypothetical protein
MIMQYHWNVQKDTWYASRALADVSQLHAFILNVHPSLNRWFATLPVSPHVR